MKWNDARDNELLLMWNNGIGLKQCAAHFKTIISTIRNRLSELRQQGKKVRNQSWHLSSLS